MVRKLGLGLLGVFAAGALFLGGCSDDDSGAECGNGLIEGAETCDGTEFGTATCASLGFTGGTLACANDCSIDTSGCTDAFCGDGEVNGTEQCDGTDLDGATCQSRGHSGGILACTSSCTFDESACTDNCGNGTLDTGEVCDGNDLGTSTCETEGFDGGDLACASDCTALVTTGCCNDACTTAGATLCTGDTLRTCEAQADGCLGYTDTDCTQNSQICDDSGATAVCAEPCVSDCTTLNDTRGNNNDVEICSASGTCLNWTLDTQCGIAAVCAVAGSGPECIPSGGGDTCGDAMFVATSYSASGADFTADYTDGGTWTGNPGCGDAFGADAVFKVWLNAGDRVHYAETGGLDAVVRVIESCDATGACLASNDSGEDRYYDATSDGFYYVVIEAYYAAPGTTDYDLLVEVLPPESDCGDGVDNDHDGLVDCEDPSCFGVAPNCSTETACDDGQDNDNDTLVDCADSDCAGVGFCEATEVTCNDGEDNDGDGDTDCADSDCAVDPICGNITGLWEGFSTSSTADVSLCTISFTPNAGTYDHTSTCGLTGLPITPGTGTVSATTLSLTDDSFVEIAIQGGWSFPFHGVAESSFYVGSNGFVTFGAGDNFANTSDTSFFAFPRIAGFDTDLDPTAGGTITVDEFADHVVITFDAVLEFNTTDTVTFQIVMYQNGDIELSYGSLTLVDEGRVGLAGYGTQGTAPGPVDLVPPPPPPPPKINEVSYDNDGTDDREFIELHADPGLDLTGYTLVHYNGSGGTIIWTIDLAGFTVPGDGFFVLGNQATTANVDVDWASVGRPLTNVIQNGPAESLVLYRDYGQATETVVDAVEYEGAASPSYAEGNPSDGVVGNWETSMVRYPDSADTDNNLVDFQPAWWATPGLPNAPTHPFNYYRVTASVDSLEAGTFPLAIPDNNLTGVTSTIDLTGGTLVAITDLMVGVRITHTYKGDLELTLTAPGGTSLILHNNTGGGIDDIIGVYDLTLTPDGGSMDTFNGINPNGIWTLTAVDSAGGDAGQILEWFLLIQ